jgi:hypothetical protein
LAAVRAREAQAERLAMNAAGKFARALHVLLRATRLYQRNHPQLLESLERSEQTLRESLEWTSPLTLRLERGAVYVRASAHDTGAGHMLPDTRGELKALADDLLRRGVHALSFQKETNMGELHSLCLLLRGLGQPGAHQPTPAEWPRLLELNQIAGIRVNPTAAEQQHVGATLAGLLAGILSLDLSALRPGPADAGSTPEPATIEELCSLLNLLSSLAAALRHGSPGSGPRADLPGVRTPEETAAVMRESIAGSDRRTVSLLISALQRQSPRENETVEPYLSRLAEMLALDFVVQTYRERGASITELRQLMDRIAHELAARGELFPGALPSGPTGVHKLPNGSLWTEEGFAEYLQECFWSELSPQEKSQTLRSREAWYVPTASLRQHLEQLCYSGNEREARHILLNYSLGLASRDTALRRAVAAGMSDLMHLVDSCWPALVPEELSRGALHVLMEEQAPELIAMLSSIVDQLARMALRKRDFAELEQILLELGKGAANAGQTHLESLGQRLLSEQNWSALMQAALENRPLDAALVRILGGDPSRVVERLTALLSQEDGLAALPAMTRLIRHLGEAACGGLVTQLFDPRTPQSLYAGAAVKLLCAAKPEKLLEALPRAIGAWEWNLQDMAVSELIRIRPAGLTPALLESLSNAHPLVVPMMLDEIGLSRETAALPTLLQIAAGQHERFHDVFVRIKAVEALGRLRNPAAADALRAILRRRDGLMHVEPAGLRAAAEEALGLIENRPSSVRVRASSEAVEKTSQPFTRPRRYLRFPVDPPLAARVVPTGGTTTVSPTGASAQVKTISLGGAFLSSQQRFSIGDALTVEIRAGLRSIQSMAVVRNISPQGGGVEFVHMKQDDREKLRKFLSKLSRQ